MFQSYGRIAVIGGCLLLTAACAANKPGADRAMPTDAHQYNAAGIPGQLHHNAWVEPNPDLAAKVMLVDGIENVKVATSDRNAYVAVKPKDSALKKTQHAKGAGQGATGSKTGSDAYPTDRTNGGYDYGGLSLTVQQAITNTVNAAAAPLALSVYITTDPAFYDRLGNMKGRISQVDEFNRNANMVFRTNNDYRMGK